MSVDSSPTIGKRVARGWSNYLGDRALFDLSLLSLVAMIATGFHEVVVVGVWGGVVTTFVLVVRRGTRRMIPRAVRLVRRRRETR